ncbi:DUF397 domain-containing protein [Streptomyces pathocidini]|uniref:DUF397 domain-containing protein n=1 Tax=Streptomyces pathocidini TaxID=1650571 RepID=A0ABW7UXM8_9ACTN|nr:DUF397 domain-containing protein [Streptomyces pathocidini]
MSTTIQWQKSSFSGGGPDNDCVEIGACAAGTLHLRESDDPEVVVTTTSARLGALIRAIKSGAYDTP